MTAKPARRAARQRRSPATSSYAASPTGLTSTGWSSPDRSGELGQGLLVEVHPRLVLVGDDAVDRQVDEPRDVALDRAGFRRDQRTEAFTQTAESSHD